MTLALVVFFVLGALCVLSVVLGLPGNWALLGLAIALELADGWLVGAPTRTFGPLALGGVALLALAGEGLELLSSALGIKGGGGSRRGMAGSMLGGLLGGLGGTALLPVLGTLVGVLVGTFAGAWLAETTGPEALPRDAAMKPAIAATIARLFGTFAKAGLGVGAWLLLLVRVLAG